MTTGLSGGAVSWSDLCPDALRVVIAQQNGPDYEGYKRNDDREGESRLDVSRASHQACGNDGEESTEPPVAEVIRERKRGVADLRGKGFDQERGDGSVDHCHEYDLHENERCQGDGVYRARVRLHGVIDRHVKNRGEEIPGHHDLLAADLVGQVAEVNEQRHD